MLTPMRGPLPRAQRVKVAARRPDVIDEVAATDIAALGQGPCSEHPPGLGVRAIARCRSGRRHDHLYTARAESVHGSLNRQDHQQLVADLTAMQLLARTARRRCIEDAAFGSTGLCLGSRCQGRYSSRCQAKGAPRSCECDIAAGVSDRMEGSTHGLIAAFSPMQEPRSRRSRTGGHLVFVRSGRHRLGRCASPLRRKQ